MERRNISSGSRLAEEGGYSRVVVVGPWVMLSGCSGFDYATGDISIDVAQQTEQTFRNIEAALAAAGASMGDVVRLSLILKDSADYPAVAPILRRHLANVRPTPTAWQAPLMDKRMKVEIEVTAYRFGNGKNGGVSGGNGHGQS